MDDASQYVIQLQIKAQDEAAPALDKAAEAVKGIGEAAQAASVQTEQAFQQNKKAADDFGVSIEELYRRIRENPPAPKLSFETFEQYRAAIEDALSRPAKNMRELELKFNQLARAQHDNVIVGKEYEAAMRELGKEHEALTAKLAKQAEAEQKSAEAKNRSASAQKLSTQHTQTATDQVQHLIESLKHVEHASHKGFGALLSASKELVGKMPPIVGGLLGIGAALIGVASVGEKVEHAAAGALDSWSRLDAMLQATGHSAGITTDQIVDMGYEIERVTGMTHDSVEDAAAAMAAFVNIKGDSFTRTLKVAGDIAAATGRDIRSTTMMLSRALETPGEYLSYMRRIGITVTDTTERMAKALQAQGKTAEAQMVILEELGRKYEGLGERMGETIVGAHRRISSAFHRIMEGGEETHEALAHSWDRIADAVSDPEFERAASRLMDAFGMMRARMIGWAADIVEALAQVFTALGGFLDGMAGKLQKFDEYIQKTFPYLAAYVKWMSEIATGVDEAEAKQHDNKKQVRGGRPLGESLQHNTAQSDAVVKRLEAEHALWQGVYSKLATERERAVMEHEKRIEEAKDKISDPSARLDYIMLLEQQHQKELAEIDRKELEQAKRKSDEMLKLAANQKKAMQELMRSSETATPEIEAYREYEDAVAALIATREKLPKSGAVGAAADDALMRGLKLAADGYLLVLAKIEEEREQLKEGIEYRLMPDEEKALADLRRTLVEIHRVAAATGTGEEWIADQSYKAWEQYERGRVELEMKANEKLLKEQTEYSRRASEIMQDSLADVFMTIGKGWKDTLHSMLNAFQQLFAQQFAMRMAELMKLPGTVSGGVAGAGPISKAIGWVFGERPAGGGGGAAAAPAAQGAAAAVAGSVTATACSCEPAIEAVTETTQEALKGVQGTVQTFSTGLLGSIRAIATGAWRGFTGLLSGIGKFIMSAIKALQGIAQAAQAAHSSGSGWLGAIVGAIGGYFTGGPAGAVAGAASAGTQEGMLATYGGPRAAGGPMSAGKFYLTGERGPELVAGPGTVIPNGALGGGRVDFKPTYNITIHGAKDDKTLFAQLAAYIERRDQENKADMMEMLRRNGLGRMAR